jgi:FkbM family methyltransferase
MTPSKWSQAARHFVPNLVGVPRYFFAHPIFALKLLKVRAEYFFTRQLPKPVATPDGFLLETTSELVSYWSFFVEREGLVPEWVQAFLAEPQSLVVDVGANAGLFAHLVWTMKPDTKFILFEPLPRMVKKIGQWAAAIHPDYTLHDKAVSNYCGTTTFFANTDNDVSASLIPGPDSHLKYEVSVTTLDSVLPDAPILLLKVDVEGSECEVLDGAKRTLERTRFLILEAHTTEALERIKKTLGDQWACKEVGASDYLFMRRSEQARG